MTSMDMTPMTENTNNESVERDRERNEVDKWLDDKKKNDPEFIKALSMLAK